MMSGVNKNVKKILNFIPENSIGAEIGVWKSQTSDLFLSKNPKKLHLVDPWSVEPYNNDQWERYVKKYQHITGGDTVEDFQDFYDSLYNTIVEKYSLQSNVTVHRSYSNEWFNSMEDNSLDWIYVDGDHSYDGCFSDLEQCLRVVKSGSYIYGDDYNNAKQEVRKAVNDFCKKYNLKLSLYADQWRILNSANI